MSKRLCPICGGRESNHLANVSCALFDDSPVSGSFAIVNCIACGFVFYDSPSDEARWQAFYKEHYLIHFYSVRENDDEQIRYFKRLVDFTADAGLPKSARIVDVGSGPGHFLSALKRSGYNNLCGIEVCQEHIDEMNRRGIEAKYSTIEGLPFVDDSVDFLSSFHVLEHLLFPNRAVGEIRRCLRENGLAMVELPDVSRYDEVSGVTPFVHFIFEHINHFDLVHLRSLFEKMGFEYVDYDNDTKDGVPILRALFRKVGKETVGEKRPEETVFPKKMAGWFAGGFRFEYPELEAALSGTDRVHLWGISYQTLMRFSHSVLRGENVLFYDIDRRKQNKTVLNRKVYPPSMLKELDNNSVVVIGVGPSARNMRDLLRGWGFCGQVFLL